MHIHYVIHESYEAPGALEEWAAKRDCSVGYSRVYESERLPESVTDIDLLIVLGGPQSPDTTIAECSYFDASAEKRLIMKCIHGHKAILGICLGAQLLGEALGAKCEHSPAKEIGCFPIMFTEEGRQNNLFAHFGASCVAGHWHNDMPGLTKSSKIIAFSEGCPRQIIEYGNRMYGFQCHLEFNKETVEQLIRHSENDFLDLSQHRFVQQPELLRNCDYRDMNEKLFTFLDKLLF
ncbi:MAG: hypothetical protein LBR49_03595 [Tannerella sp.]|jgi:GMP synthase (glutamine-hydrolysing)|nr:hypothetical protein [Tannerella sp.]